MQQLGQTVSVHSTRLKDRLLTTSPHLEELETSGNGKDTMIAMTEDIISQVLMESIQRDFDNEGSQLRRAA